MIATVERQTIKHQFSRVQELIERFFKIQREAGFCFDWRFGGLDRFKSSDDFLFSDR
jgi:hypothetical protein